MADGHKVRGRSLLTYGDWQMDGFESLKIDLRNIGEDGQTFSFSLGDSYFEAVGAPEVRRGDAAVTLAVRRVATSYFELAFHIDATVTVQCDRCLDDMRLPISTDGQLTARLGEGNLVDDNLVVTVAEDDGVIDVAWNIYEFLALAIPIKHVHADGECNPAMVEALREHAAANPADAQGPQAADPRWSGLEKLKTIIKD